MKSRRVVRSFSKRITSVGDHGFAGLKRPESSQLNPPSPPLTRKSSNRWADASSLAPRPQFHLKSFFGSEYRPNCACAATHDSAPSVATTQAVAQELRMG